VSGEQIGKGPDGLPGPIFRHGHLRNRTPWHFAAGLAKAGARPIVAIYSTFLAERAYDQIFQEVALQNLPVTFCLDRAGLTGPDGPTITAPSTRRTCGCSRTLSSWRREMSWTWCRCCGSPSVIPAPLLCAPYPKRIWKKSNAASRPMELGQRRNL